MMSNGFVALTMLLRLLCFPCSASAPFGPCLNCPWHVPKIASAPLATARLRLHTFPGWEWGFSLLLNCCNPSNSNWKWRAHTTPKGGRPRSLMPSSAACPPQDPPLLSLMCMAEPWYKALDGSPLLVRFLEAFPGVLAPLPGAASLVVVVNQQAERAGEGVIELAIPTVPPVPTDSSSQAPTLLGWRLRQHRCRAVAAEQSSQATAGRGPRPAEPATAWAHPALSPAAKRGG